MGSTHQLVLEKLAESGLTAADLKALKFQALDGPETAALGSSFQKLPSLYIPYLTPDGKPASVDLSPAGRLSDRQVPDYSSAPDRDWDGIGHRPMRLTL